ncbi:MAG: SDR family NAD(P)-dependent oxidoreductase [Bacteroidota bacterium]
MELEGNKLLITGATSGIGEALLKRFLQLNNQVIAVGRNSERLAELAKADKRVIPFCCDLSKVKELEKLMGFLKEEHLDTNILINNAGIQYNYEFEAEHQLLDKVVYEINVNFTAPLRLIAMMIPVLKSNKNSAIVSVSSGLGLVPKKQAPVYCGTKAGIHIFSKALRYQLKRIKVFEIIPPLVDTNMTAGRGKGKISPDQLVDEFIRAFRKNRFEVNIGKVKLLKFINRLSPALADRIMKNGGSK